jgi:predicted anti-sigma-YlaC factor YlaD
VTCAETRLLVSSARDGEASQAQRAVVAEHLAGCADCRQWVTEIDRLEATLANQWTPVRAPQGFAQQVAGRLPARETRRATTRAPRWMGAMAASLLLFVVLGVLTQPAAVASLALFLRQVVLRETLPPPINLSAPLERVSLQEAQQRVSWDIQEPATLPVGYRLVGVYVGDIHSFAIGSTVWLQYARDDAPSSPYLAVVEVRAGSQIDEPVAPRHSKLITLSEEREALFIDGRFTDTSPSVWETGTLLRLILEDEEGLVIQLQADPRDGWTEAQLVEVASSLR